MDDEERRPTLTQRTPEIVSRLADKGEEALKKIAGTPAGQKLVDNLDAFRTRLDELQKRVLGIEALEKKVVQLEKRLKAVEKDIKKHADASEAHKTKA